ncbi:hypothetical protein SPHINGOT1_80275 [Sphingomonas sp. T1]|nr:hypothetical protein SPHINGOT1_80275 [Sphingomonas sp. T1]
MPWHSSTSPYPHHIFEILPSECCLSVCRCNDHRNYSRSAVLMPSNEYVKIFDMFTYKILSQVRALTARYVDGVNECW